jgi:hypothetical protein
MARESASHQVFSRIWSAVKQNWVTTSVITGVVTVFLAVLVIVSLGYWYNWAWTGVGTKTLWHWLNLLVVPLVLGAGGYLVTRALAWSDQQVAAKQANEAARDQSLDSTVTIYIHTTAALLVNQDNPREPAPLPASQEGDVVRIVTRARTLIVLESLDPARRGTVLRYLYELGLIRKEDPIVRLHGANLTGVQLANAKLQHVDVSNANLTGADLNNASLESANLRNANLQGANLRRSRLVNADLRDSDLEGADLTEADLRSADLSGAQGITRALLEEQAITLEGATMPDGSRHP